MLRQSRKPYGFKDLLVYKKSEELQKACSLLTQPFPPLKTLYALADQMNRSARSVKQNIVEGWKRNSTKEYYEFLGFSIGALTELEEDCNDIWNGIYPDLMGIKGIMGEKGNEMGIKGIMGEKGNPTPPLNPLTPIQPFFDIEKIPFYPLDKNLPLVVQLKLRCKELNFLLKKLQDSLSDKMEKEKTLSSYDRYSVAKNRQRESDQFEKEILTKYGVKDRKG